MSRRYRPLFTCLIIFIFLLLAGCVNQESETQNKTTPATTTEVAGQSQATPFISSNPTPAITQIIPDPDVTSVNPAATHTPVEDLRLTIYLATMFKDSFAQPNYQPSEPEGSVQASGTWQAWPVLPMVSDRAWQIYQAGLAQGNDPTHFSKVGDCQNIRQYFLGLFDTPDTYRLGEQYAYLQETIDYFSGNWSRLSEAVRTGFNVASVLSPLHASPENCQPTETPLACENRIWNPSFMLISMETWTPDRPVQVYEDYLRQIVEYAISENVLPILATKADNIEGDHAINQVIVEVADEYDIPLWNYWAATNPLTDQGLMEDRFHLTNGPNFFDDPISLDLGWPIRNLTGLMTVDAVWKAVR